MSYTFRVCGRYGTEGKWGPWSIPRSGITALDQHGKDLFDHVQEYEFEFQVFSK